MLTEKRRGEKRRGLFSAIDALRRIRDKRSPPRYTYRAGVTVVARAAHASCDSLRTFTVSETTKALGGRIAELLYLHQAVSAGARQWKVVKNVSDGGNDAFSTW